jgi:hypothetical protein
MWIEVNENDARERKDSISKKDRKENISMRKGEGCSNFWVHENKI